MSDELRSDPSAGTPQTGLSDASTVLVFDVDGVTVEHCEEWTRVLAGPEGFVIDFRRLCDILAVKVAEREREASERPADINDSDADGAKREEGE
jgi:Ethanolamine utilization protein EutJ (predicted chaperonin)